MQLVGVIIVIAFFFSSGLSALGLSSSSEGEGIVRNSSPTISIRKCHINVCLAIDGSGSVSNFDFSLQKFFAFDLISWFAGIDDRFSVGFGAVQYGNRSHEISRVSEDLISVVEAVDDASLKGGSSTTSVAAGIDGCSYLLAHSKAGLPVVVLMGDGRNNIGYDPVQAGNMFRRDHRNGEIHGVGVGFADVSALQAITANGKVFTVQEHRELANVILNSASVACKLD